MSIILPNIQTIDELDPISGGPDAINANFAELSSYADTVSAGLTTLATIGDVLTDPASIQTVVTPSVLNQRLSSTFDVLPAISNVYSLGNIVFPYKNVHTGFLYLSGAQVTISGSTFLIDGVPIDTGGVGPHNLDDSDIHTNISGNPDNGMSFVYNSVDSAWNYAYFPILGSEAPSPVFGQTLTFSGTGSSAGWYPTFNNNVSLRNSYCIGISYIYNY
jgi:hypothetical protein